MVAAWGVVAWLAHSRSGVEGVWVATLTAGICLAGAMAALILSSKVHGPNAAMLRLASGMAFRMGVPLAACLVMMQWPRLTDHGGLMMMAFFYLVALAVETPLSLKYIDRKPIATDTRARHELV
ncbi:MAG: hypothetical protein K8T91_15990 [Planctomycetes bacterium]|nr:hypothetical protein [Planctomycetota bacterium]